MVQHLEEIVIDLRKSGISILLVEQNLYSALATSERIYVLDTGKIVYEGVTKDLAGDPEPLFEFLGVH